MLPFQIGTTSALNPVPSFGSVRKIRRWRAIASWRICPIWMPGFRRTVTHICLSVRCSSSQLPWPLISGAITMGIHRPNVRPGTEPRNSGGATPTMVSLRRFTDMIFPTTAGSAWNIFCHTRWLITATGYAPGVSPYSPGEKARPISGRTPSTAK